MPAGRRDPFAAVEQLLERVGRDLDAAPWRSGVAVDVADHGDRYVVTADLPGLDRDAVDVRLVGGVLHLAADPPTEADEEDVTYRRRERRHEAVSRRVRLPEAVDADGVAAAYDRGVLRVELPKRALGEGTSIDVD